MRRVIDVSDDYDSFEGMHENPRYKRVLKENPLADTPLFDAAMNDPITPPRTIKDSATQHAAFDALLPKLESRQQQVLAALRERGPSTTTDIAQFLAMHIHLVSGRITELKKMGYVIESGTMLNTNTNRHNSLWKAV